MEASCQIGSYQAHCLGKPFPNLPGAKNGSTFNSRIKKSQPKNIGSPFTVLKQKSPCPDIKQKPHSGQGNKYR